tara:strand:+ start:41 stop:295 length:255 start_codon:yes stop_codon:yes gene_type:complete
MRRKKNFRKKPKDDSVGLQVKVYNNNIEGALKKFKRKVKDSGLFLDLRKKQYYIKPSEIKREKRNLAKSRAKYQILKEKNKNNH